MSGNGNGKIAKSVPHAAHRKWGYCIVLGWYLGDTLGMNIAGGVGLLIASLTPCFHHLNVQDQGEVLGIRFGPIPLFRRTVRYADIERVEIGRTLILDGWGIHMSIRGAVVWNLWGRDCVVVHLKKGVLRIGTHDAENLAGFLQKKMESSPPTASPSQLL